jgi:hypothetical protein
VNLTGGGGAVFEVDSTSSECDPVTGSCELSDWKLLRKASMELLDLFLFFPHSYSFSCVPVVPEPSDR